MPATILESVLMRLEAVESRLASFSRPPPRFAEPRSLGLSGVEWRLLERLMQRAPDAVSLAELMAILPRGNQPDTLRGHVMRLRAKIMPAAIVSDHSRGYRMAVADVEYLRGLN